MWPGTRLVLDTVAFAAAAIPVCASALDFGESIKPSLLVASAHKTEVDGLGLELRSLSPVERRVLSVPEGGLLVARVSNGAARRAGLQQGDVVLMVNGVHVTGMSQFYDIERQLPHDRPVPVLVRRPQGTLFLPLYASR
jgi:serine protease Do